jgi:hypothetical protein
MFIREKIYLDADVNSCRTANIDLCAWVDDNNKVQNAISLRTGACYTQNSLNQEEAERLIMLLQRHIHNIKTCECEALCNEKNSFTATPQEGVPVLTTEIQKRRAARLKSLLASNGGAAEVERKYENISASYLSQLINGFCSFGEKAARSLEQKLNLPEQWLDQEDKQAA